MSDSQANHFTLFKPNGDVQKLPKEPTHREMMQIIESDTLNDVTFGFFYNGKDHHDCVIICDDIGAKKGKPINPKVSEGLTKSEFWRNCEYKMCWNVKHLLVTGNIIVVSNSEL